MASNKGYIRPNSAEYFYSFEKQFAGDMRKIVAIEDAIASAEYTSTTSKQYVTADVFGETIICGGAPFLHSTGKVVFPLNDTLTTATDAVVTECDMIRMPIKAADACATGGVTLYWDDTNEYLTITSSSNTKVAISLEAKETLGATNTRKLPAGDWVLVQWSNLLNA